MEILTMIHTSISDIQFWIVVIGSVVIGSFAFNLVLDWIAHKL